MSLSKNQIKYLRARCHNLNPVVMLGQKGLTDAVLEELDRALEHHELVKIKLPVDGKAERTEIARAICERSGSEVVQQIGKALSVYRRNSNKPVISLPDQ